MENASKALIIAGAILISIVLITLGVLIIQRGQTAVDSAQIDDTTLQALNSKITRYCGDKVSGDKVNALLETVVSNNLIAVRDGAANEKLISIETMGKAIDTSGNETTGIGFTNGNSPKITKRANASVLYKVTVSKYKDNGMIDIIQIYK